MDTRRSPFIAAIVRLTADEHVVGGQIESARMITFKDIDPGLSSHRTETIVLQRYPNNLFADAAAEAPAPPPSDASHGPVPSTFDDLALNVVRLSPDSLPDDALRSVLPSIIAEEQSAYRAALATNERPASAIFERDEIDGHDPAFVAGQLLPKFRNFVRHAGATTSMVLTSGIDLSQGELIYDSATSTLLLKKHYPLLLDPPRGDAYDATLREVRLKVSALKVVDGHVAYEPHPVIAPGERAPPIAPNLSRVLEAISPPYLALDRLLLTSDLPMPPAAAERLVGLLRQSNTHLMSVVTYTVESASGSGSALTVWARR